MTTAPIRTMFLAAILVFGAVQTATAAGDEGDQKRITRVLGRCEESDKACLTTAFNLEDRQLKILEDRTMEALKHHRRDRSKFHSTEARWRKARNADCKRQGRPVPKRARDAAISACLIDKTEARIKDVETGLDIQP
jgi:uncharacterized protein YecT (DUF1311 family)